MPVSVKTKSVRIPAVRMTMWYRHSDLLLCNLFGELCVAEDSDGDCVLTRSEEAVR